MHCALKKSYFENVEGPDSITKCCAGHALDAVANKRRKAASTVKVSPASLVQSFALTSQRYREVVRFVRHSRRGTAPSRFHNWLGTPGLFTLGSEIEMHLR
jgi:hypothetical protein